MALDSVTFELIKNQIEMTTDEMTLTVLRTAYSGNVRDGMDFSAAICSADGEMVAQGLCIALHLGSIPDAMRAVLDRFANDCRPGDVFILNDPYMGGMHLPDIFVFSPVFIGTDLLCYMVVVADHADIGGRVPGGRSVDATEIYQEGLRIPPLKLQDGGRPVEAVWSMIARNVRLPDKVLGDLRSCMAACHTAEGLMKHTVARYGIGAVRDFFQQTLDYSERLAKDTIAQLNPGQYLFEDYLDDSVTSPEPVVIKLAMEVRRSSLIFDLTGSSAQVPASINSTLSFTKSAVYAAVRTLMPSDTPNNGGLFRPVEVRAPAGTVVNANEPAPVASRGVTGFRVLDAVLGALAEAAPGRIPAAGEGGVSSFRVGGHDEHGVPFVLFDSVQGTWGGRSDIDGVDGCSNFAANATNVPVEVVEAEYPLRVICYEFRTDSGGPGRFRGGLGLRREWELLAPEALITMRADRSRFRPWGLAGGQPGAASHNFLIVDGRRRELPSKIHRRVRRGERFLHEQAAGGGYGDPMERNPDAVFADWHNEKITVGHARRSYGVVIDVTGRRVDLDATDVLRGRMRRRAAGKRRQ